LARRVFSPIDETGDCHASAHPLESWLRVGLPARRLGDRFGGAIGGSSLGYVSERSTLERESRSRGGPAGTGVLTVLGLRVRPNRGRGRVAGSVGCGMRRALRAIVAAIAVGLLLAPDAFARAGGGTSGFGRGGG
jgi:hypothetical protein